MQPPDFALLPFHYHTSLGQRYYVRVWIVYIKFLSQSPEHYRYLIVSLATFYFYIIREKKIERTLAPTRGQASQVLDPELVRKDLSELKSGYQPGVKNSEVKI